MESFLICDHGKLRSLYRLWKGPRLRTEEERRRERSSGKVGWICCSLCHFLWNSFGKSFLPARLNFSHRKDEYPFNASFTKGVLRLRDLRKQADFLRMLTRKTRQLSRGERNVGLIQSLFLLSIKWCLPRLLRSVSLLPKNRYFALVRFCLFVCFLLVNKENACLCRRETLEGH